MPKDLAIFFPVRGRPNTVFKRAAPENYRTRCFSPSCRREIIHPLNEPTDLTRVETVPGAACLPRLAVMHAPRQISPGLWGTTQSGSPLDSSP
jgi:hypothetical protein